LHAKRAAKKYSLNSMARARRHAEQINPEKSLVATIRTITFCRNPEPLVETPDHLQRQRALTGEHLINTIATADKWNQIVRG